MPDPIFYYGQADYLAKLNELYAVADALAGPAGPVGPAGPAGAAGADGDITPEAIAARDAAIAASVAADSYSDEAAISAATATTQAGISTTQAGISTTQAGIATTKAAEAATSAFNADASADAALASQTAAATSASNAGTSATNANTSASTATTQAGIATTQAGIATTKAAETSTSATTSTTQAGIATTKASEAADSAAAAAQSASEASAGQINSDWNAVSGVAQILNKPTTLSGYGITDAATAASVALKADLASPLFSGTVSVGATAGITSVSLEVNRNLKNGTIAYGVRSNGVVQPTVTSEAMSFASFLNTAAAVFTVPDYEHFFVGQGVVGAGSTVTRQSGLYVASNMVGAGTNYGVNLNIPVGTNRWNLYSGGTAINHMNGALLLGTITWDTVSKLQVTGNTALTGNLSVSGTTTGITKTMVGLGNVENTTDAAKQISTLTQAALDLKLNLSGGTITGPIIFSDQEVSRVILKDQGYKFLDKGTGAAASTQTLDYTAGSCQRLQIGGALTIATDSWPPTNNAGFLILELVNGAAFAVTWPTINWVKSDGTTTTTFGSNGITLKSSGTDWVLLWTRDAGTTIYGKVLR